MMKILKNRIYLPMIIAIFIALVSFISLIFLKNQTYFTINIILNIFINFALTSYLLLVNDNVSNTFRFRCISLYLLTTLFILILDVVIASFTWNLNHYSNLMYLTNIKFYLSLYSIFVVAMALLSIYVIIKEIISKPSVRQTSTKQ